MRRACAFTSTVLVLLAGCAKADGDRSVADSHAAADSLANMMGGEQASGNTVARQMELHLKTMGELTTDSIKALLPGHRQLVESLITGIKTEMRVMKLAADPAWSAVVDSLRADLREMPNLAAADLQVRMPAHDARLVRLIQLHQTKLRTMKER